ncbi:MAG: murein L,D-transpeptidase catalytic domain-containing protein [Parvularculaceae bacterium]
MAFDRRAFLISGLAAVAPKPLLAANASMVETARRLLEQNAARIEQRDVAAIADYGAPSWRPRFHLVDVSKSSVVSLLVAHGRGSDPRHTGWLQAFSNEVGSNASSAGAYLTGDIYYGKYGRSMRLVGLDKENANAKPRAIVIHSAWYVGEDMLAKHGKLGRSEGCFTLSQAGLAKALDLIGPGRLLFAGKF